MLLQYPLPKFKYGLLDSCKSVELIYSEAGAAMAISQLVPKQEDLVS